MTEASHVLLICLLVLLGFFAWGIDADWRTFVIDVESRALIDVFGSRAYDLGRISNEALLAAFGTLPLLESRGFQEGLVLGLREVITRLYVLRAFGALMVLGLIGTVHEAHVLHAVRSEAFRYTSPLTHRRAQTAPKAILLVFLLLLVSPLPLRPWILPSLTLAFAWAMTRRKQLSMKE
jgi:hypothetical protein